MEDVKLARALKQMRNAAANVLDSPGRFMSITGDEEFEARSSVYGLLTTLANLIELSDQPLGFYPHLPMLQSQVDRLTKAITINVDTR